MDAVPPSLLCSNKRPAMPAAASPSSPKRYAGAGLDSPKLPIKVIQ
jgi:hypothetical protein